MQPVNYQQTPLLLSKSHIEQVRILESAQLDTGDVTQLLEPILL